ncbi:hypothetical protein BDK51DRAFT_37766 [Blyttiomyces helicus]|uniref:Uncharacterized protein n=1 Tax=Blyttiomyces helicus TaxID=388810 RepID=A0A4V1ISF1_9FUNG|nr:hypothetical protein BDK51DRAFT_37766 [Blyttiomyces helicus]|eukprot:RKO93337.1 hypothetical protein BDK51DRAFT_37766 [Blyttiomyces helicus]
MSQIRRKRVASIVAVDEGLVLPMEPRITETNKSEYFAGDWVSEEIGSHESPKRTSRSTLPAIGSLRKSGATNHRNEQVGSEYFAGDWVSEEIGSHESPKRTSRSTLPAIGSLRKSGATNHRNEQVGSEYFAGDWVSEDGVHPSLRHAVQDSFTVYGLHEGIVYLAGTLCKERENIPRKGSKRMKCSIASRTNYFRGTF